MYLWLLPRSMQWALGWAGTLKTLEYNTGRWSFPFSNLTVVQISEKDKASRRSMWFSLHTSSSPHTGGFPAAGMSAGESVAGRPWHSWQPKTGAEESGSTLLNGKRLSCPINHWSPLNLRCKPLCYCRSLNHGWEFKFLLEPRAQIHEHSLS